MGRANYSDDVERWEAIMYRGAVASAFRGRRGQAFLKEMLAALDALPEKRLIKSDLINGDGCVCAMGAVGLARGLDMATVDPYDSSGVSGMFGIADAMAREIAYENDEGVYATETPEQRFTRMRAWVAGQILAEVEK